MPRVTLNGRVMEVREGATLLEAAGNAGIGIPTLCHLQGLEPFTSCMICAVKDMTTGRLLPACSTPAVEGMVVETDSAEVRLHRKRVLELLMGEHAGDCEAPCQMTCPARMEIPVMLRQIAEGRIQEALVTVREAIALPGVVGHICPAPCEKGCRRGRHDAPVSICVMERCVAAGAAGVADTPAVAGSGRRVAIVGAGPAGLAAAYYLAKAGHGCTIFDEQAAPGGALRYQVPATALPPEVLERDVEVIRRLGVEFKMNTRIEPGAGLDRLRTAYDAVVLAPGRGSGALSAWGLVATERGLTVAGGTFRSSDPMIFAGGEAVHAGKLAVRAMAHGRSMACAINQFLSGVPVTGEAGSFQSRLGRLRDTELAECVRDAEPAPRLAAPRAPASLIVPEAAAQEGRRCLHCDCRRVKSCRLRDYATEYNVDHSSLKTDGRLTVSVAVSTPVAGSACGDRVVYEAGKCIKCGICVRIAATAEDGLGLAFTGRGFGTVMAAPFNATLAAGMGEKAGECIRHCPTGALAWEHAKS